MPSQGPRDFYATLGTTIAEGVKLALTYHHLWDDALDVSFRNEADLVVSKSITKHVTVLAKGATFQGENGQPDLTRASIGVGIVY